MPRRKISSPLTPHRACATPHAQHPPWRTPRTPLPILAPPGIGDYSLASLLFSTSLLPDLAVRPGSHAFQRPPLVDRAYVVLLGVYLSRPSIHLSTRAPSLGRAATTVIFAFDHLQGTATAPIVSSPWQNLTHEGIGIAILQKSESQMILQGCDRPANSITSLQPCSYEVLASQMEMAPTTSLGLRGRMERYSRVKGRHS